MSWAGEGGGLLSGALFPIPSVRPSYSMFTLSFALDLDCFFLLLFLCLVYSHEFVFDSIHAQGHLELNIFSRRVKHNKYLRSEA